jgi:hypothetical protein
LPHETTETWRITMSDEHLEFDEPFDVSSAPLCDVEPVVFDDDDVPFDPFTPRWTS